MQTTKDRYQIVETPTSITYKPYFTYKNFVLKLLAIIAIPTGFVLFIPHLLPDAILWLCYIGILMGGLAILQVMFFNVHICYTFDTKSNAVYRTMPILGKKKLMNFSEAVVFQTSDNNGWQYAVGEKKKQFLKNYKISERFGSGKVSAELNANFEQEVLGKINKLIGHNI